MKEDAGRTGHAFGNRLFNGLYQTIFGRDFTDILSGYRVFTRRFVKSFPGDLARIRDRDGDVGPCLPLKLPVCEVQLDYGRRPEGSSSKLSTFRDGLKILLMFARLMKETQPFRFFGLIAGALLAASVFFMIPPVYEYLTTGLVNRVPTWIGAIGILTVSVLMLVTGLVLDSVAAGRVEQMRMAYLNQPPHRGEMRPATARKSNRRSDAKRVSSARSKTTKRAEPTAAG